ncbi:MAG: indole-3-glycerol phosphate synthase TrpC [Gammaproteobacteria bacterium]|nr:indole-3-glycerol phosphate synthase TrpC [Gammaproteobacteria bacterium]
MATANPNEDILRIILRQKVIEVTAAAAKESIVALSERAADAPPPRGFVDALRNKIAAGQPAVIAEIKKASPSKGVIRRNIDSAAIAKSYASAGAACLSVLTDQKFFQGSNKYLQQARAACNLPVLRKDFVIDQYQVYEARAIGADCILLIVAALGDATLLDLLGLAAHLDMDALVEVHNQDEMERALEVGAKFIGINNRDLRTFQTNLHTTLELRQLVGDDVLLVTESGIHDRDDVEKMRANHINAFLVGEAFMCVPDPGSKLSELFYK